MVKTFPVMESLMGSQQGVMVRLNAHPDPKGPFGSSMCIRNTKSNDTADLCSLVTNALLRRGIVWIYLEVLEGLATLLTSVGEGPEGPEEEKKIPVLFHSGMKVESVDC